MTSRAVTNTAGRTCTSTSYEELRTHVLGEATVGRPSGLIVLLRQGVTAWMRGRVASSSSTLRAAQTPGLGVDNETHAAVARVLASMVLAADQEMCT